MILGIDLGGSATKLAAMDGNHVLFCRYIPHSQLPAEDAVNGVLRKCGLIFDAIAVTGVSAAIFDFSRLESAAPVTRALEVLSLAAGADYLTAPGDKLTVSIGTGTAFVLSQGEKVTHIGGSAFGGGALQGLCRRILGFEPGRRFEELTRGGDLANVDLLMSELPSCPPSLDPKLTAANLAKTGESTSDADWALGLLNLVLQTIGSMAYLAASGYGVKTVVITGGPTAAPCAKRILEPFSAAYGMHFIVPEHSECAAAIGAAVLLSDALEVR